VLEAAFPKGVRVVTVREALFGALKPHDLTDNLCIVVTILDAFRVENKEGRKVYEVNGYLMSHFENLPPEFEARLERDESGLVVQSLANVIRLYNPMVVLDEGHNAQTILSFDTLARLNPAFMLEYTATPRGHSNVLVNVPATDLKQEAMVKLPLWLQNRTDWRAALRDAKARRDDLEKDTQAERKATGDYVRPILLIQAEPKSKTDPERTTVERVKEFLLDELKISPEQVAIKTGDRDELAGVDLFSQTCPVRYIITVYALKEGWDCNFAYVLTSVASLGQRLAVEQLIGRILRLPQARRKQTEALNYAYVYTVSPKFHAAAKAVKEGLVGNGYAPDDVQEWPEKEKPSLAIQRAVEDADTAVPMLAVLNGNNVWRRLGWGHLIGGFDLAACNPAITFALPDEERAAWIDVEEQEIVQKQAQQLSLDLFREKPLNADELVRWLDLRLRNRYISQKAKRAFFQQVIAHLLAQQGEDYLTELTHHRFHLLGTLSEVIDRYLEEYARKKLLAYKGAGRLGAAGEVPYSLPDSVVLVQAHPDTFQRHLFAQAGKMDDEESILAEKLDALDNPTWWYRNRENEDFYLQGWWGRFYPDFIAKTKNGVCLALEYKGEHLATAEDADRKEKLGKIWEEVSCGQCRFWMVTAQDIDVVIEAIKRS
jgi:hypothetical protein